jgi:hypothetical protein
MLHRCSRNLLHRPSNPPLQVPSMRGARDADLAATGGGRSRRCKKLTPLP